MIQPAVLDALLAAGASAEMIVEAVKAAQRDEAARKAELRARDAERQRRARGARRLSALSRAVRVTPPDVADAPPNEEYSNPPVSPSSDEDRTPSLLQGDVEQRVVAAWNGSAAPAGALPSRGLTPRRRSALRARLAEHGEAALLEAVAHLAASPFHCGANDRGWRASLGWLLTSPENFQKMLELAPPAAAPSRTMGAQERAQAAERTAALFERMGRFDEATELRRMAKCRRLPSSHQGER